MVIVNFNALIVGINKKTREKEKDSRFGQMVRYMKGSGAKIKLMGKDD